MVEAGASETLSDAGSEVDVPEVDAQGSDNASDTENQVVTLNIYMYDTPHLQHKQ